MPADNQLTSAEIDALCDSFEQLCKSVQGEVEEFPRIEDYLENLSQEDREEVLRELLIIEHHYRTRSGMPLGDDQYHQRFAEHSHVVDEVLNAGIGHRNDTQLRDGTSPTIASGDPEHTFDSLLEAIPADEAADVGQRLGDYELLDELGRGGMGIVFRARQLSVDRLVALKILRRDKLNELDEDSRVLMIDRFRTESQSAAQLEHDHIVPVYEVGEEDGIHFYSMRYVQGESLAEVIADHPLDNSSAAEAIEPIARALEAAHGKGVLHRDIKPRNIMIDDATGRPLLTDFGLAKLLESQQEMTHTGDVMGSPPYMSPEQATDAAHVTHSADVYSLGATFYHALTGRPPFQAATMAETMRQVWFEEPPTPRSLNPAIDRDLETICMKCLEKEPSRRYENAREMADELGRYLRGEPILSRPIGWLGQLQRWRRRNPAVANLAGVVVLLIVIGIVGNIYYTIQLRKSLNETQARMGLAVSAVNKMTEMATKEDGLKAYGVDDVRREMLNASREYYDQFVEKESDDPSLEMERGKAYGHLADIEADLGNQEESIRLYQQCVAVFAGLEQRLPNEPNYTYLRAVYQRNLGMLYRDNGRLGEANSALREAYALASELHSKQPAVPKFAALLAEVHDERGVVYADLGEIEKAEKSRLETVNLWRQIFEAAPQTEYEHELAASHNDLGFFYRRVDEDEKAREHFEKARQIWQRLTSEEELIAKYAAGVAGCDYILGIIELESGNLSEAEGFLVAAEGRRRHLAERHAQLPEYQNDLADSLDSIGRLFHVRQQFDQAEEEYRTALVIREDLRNRFPSIPKYDLAYAASQLNLGKLYNDGQRFAEATDCSRIAVDVLERVVEANPSDVKHRDALAGAYYVLALSLASSGETADPKEATEIYRRILQLRKGEELSDAQVREAAVTCVLLARLLGGMSEFEAAREAATAAIELVEYQGQADLSGHLVAAYSARATIHGIVGNYAAAVKDWGAIVKILPQPRFQLLYGVALARAGRHAEAIDVVDQLSVLDEEASEPALLQDAACVFSRALEAVEADTNLSDAERAELITSLLQRGTEFIERLLAHAKEDRDLWAEQIQQHPDLARLMAEEQVLKLLTPGETSEVEQE